MEEEKKGILILMPMAATIMYEPFMCYTELFMNLVKDGYTIKLMSVSKHPHAIARNHLSKEAVDLIKEDPSIKLVVWLDDDHIFEPDTLYKMMTVLDDFDLDVLSAAYLTRSNPMSICALSINNFCPDGVTPSKYRMMVEYQPDTLYEVDAVGFGLVLMRPKVLVDVFNLTPVPAEFVARENDHVMGEDITYSEWIKKAGYKIFVHTGIFIGHTHQIVLDLSTKKYIDMMRKDSVAENHILKKKMEEDAVLVIKKEEDGQVEKST